MKRVFMSDKCAVEIISDAPLPEVITVQLTSGTPLVTEILREVSYNITPPVERSIEEMLQDQLSIPTPTGRIAELGCTTYWKEEDGISEDFLTIVKDKNPDDLHTEGKRFVYAFGSKITHAVPMTRGDYNRLRNWVVPEEENPDDEGYLVQYVDDLPANCHGFTGYVSWAPKHVFERAYMPISVKTV